MSELERAEATTDAATSNDLAQGANPVTATRTSEPAHASVIAAQPPAQPASAASRRVGDPIRTVASIVTPPVIRAGQFHTLASQRPATPYLEACAGLSGVQPRLINRVTGQAIDCGPAAAGDIRSGAASTTDVVPRMTLAEACAMAAQSRRPVIDQATGRPINCAVAPASAPASGSIAAPPPGYRGVWEDGRVNPQRGIPTATAQPVSMPTTAAASDQASSAQTALVPTGGYFVQVGTYGVPSNADRAAGRVRAMGYPVALARLQRQGQALQAVAAGPFSDAASVNAALSWARSAGYSDAFVRR
ncbi:MAG: SPOR domain-containing protein [Flavimaricola sp.]|nr:SPOR domain-containing protein [Flavimaricola sp.]